MTLRLQADALRLRLRRDDVGRLLRDGAIEVVVRLGPDPAAYWTWRLELSAADVPGISLAGNRLTVTVPRQEAHAWADGQRTGFYGTTPWGLALAIEKDFRCQKQGGDARAADDFERPADPGAGG